jgi:lipoprotein-anchoring transpeptidase ErfK/SrfK
MISTRRQTIRPSAGTLRAALGVTSLALFAAGCTSIAGPAPVASDPAPAIYGAIDDGGNAIPAVNLAYLPTQYRRQEVATPWSIPDEPGTIVVDTRNRFLYLVGAGGRSMRYGIGVGRAGFSWSGEATIRDKQRWPRWIPPKEMVARDPLAAEWANGMPGGIDNPLGARALYLWQGNKDTLYRLHGTNDPSSIGKAVSSGCVRLVNQDMIDLYNRVPVGTRVIVLSAPESIPVAELFEPIFGPLLSTIAGPRTPPANVGPI